MKTTGQSGFESNESKEETLDNPELQNWSLTIRYSLVPCLGCLLCQMYHQEAVIETLF